jgi:MATE family multidrug resistance protein
MGFISALFVALPNVFLSLFSTQAGPDEPAIHALATRLLGFVAAYNMFDATLIIMSSVLRGAGDMRFIMRVSMIGAAALVAATWLAVERLGVGVYGCWAIVTVWIWLLAATYVVRYRQGKWQSMRVIDQQHHGAGHAPASDADEFDVQPIAAGGMATAAD